MRDRFERLLEAKMLSTLLNNEANSEIILQNAEYVNGEKILEKLIEVGGNGN